jgi:Uma2 family endonuclease
MLVEEQEHHVMSGAVLPTPHPALPAPAGSVAPTPIKWTCDDFYMMENLPSVRGRKILLLDGEVLVMPPPSPLASIAHSLVEEWLRTAFPASNSWVRVQLGMFFGINTDPVPDLAVVEGPSRTHSRHPRTALLIVEIADTSLAMDLGDKASLYAAAGIADYWVIDVNDRRLHLHRDPQPDPNAKDGSSYKQVSVLVWTDLISPLAAPTQTVQLGDFLP